MVTKCIKYELISLCIASNIAGAVLDLAPGCKINPESLWTIVTLCVKPPKTGQGII